MRWEAISINPEITRQLPVWFHLGASNELKKLNNRLYANCLRAGHKALSVGKLEALTLRQDPSHRKHHKCPCTNCTYDRTLQCKKPFKCMQLAKDILTCILPKWNPQSCTTPYALNISPEQIATVEETQSDQAPAPFDPIFPTTDSLDSGFRAFITPRTPCTLPARQIREQQRNTPELIRIIIACSHQINRNSDHESSGVAWLGHGNIRNKAIKLPEDLAAPGAREAGALLTAISTLPTNIPL
ncbi:uncharacterized protein HD556DRAFT_1250283, partial [Suillus plorans]